jgi:hypothetical protein
VNEVQRFVLDLVIPREGVESLKSRFILGVFSAFLFR